MTLPQMIQPSAQELMDFRDAAAKGDCAALKEFLKTYGNLYIDDQDDYGYTALMYAANMDNTQEALELLLENGANLDEQAFGNRTALSVAEDRKLDRTITILREWPQKQAEIRRTHGKQTAEQRIHALKQKRPTISIFKNRPL